MEIHFEWDIRKARANLRKHGVSFRDSVKVFSDPLAISILDVWQESGEERWVTIGSVSQNYHVVVIHTWRDHADSDVTVRLISARKATVFESRQYQEGVNNA